MGYTYLNPDAVKTRAEKVKGECAHESNNFSISNGGGGGLPGFKRARA